MHAFVLPKPLSSLCKILWQNSCVPRDMRFNLGGWPPAHTFYFETVDWKIRIFGQANEANFRRRL
ncbi:MAG: hypothetical protein DWQ10_00850 [Calditrichaeota bacterium]|nr:MAG: hypothetical protein DWQ10_00850 [Calditrichota bacterium]